MESMTNEEKYEHQARVAAKNALSHAMTQKVLWFEPFIRDAIKAGVWQDTSHVERELDSALSMIRRWEAKANIGEKL